MKNNRQIGLDGKIFISTAMRRGTFFVLMLMLYGIVTAIADILKLTGASGVAMGSFTTTLLIYDFIVSLMLVVVVFYAYFLECGADVPVVREKPLVIFGFFRLGYYLLLSYYLCYRMLYCAVNRESVSTSVCIFYGVYLCLIVLLILANCYIFNIITRNLIRRSYEKSFHNIAIIGFVVQALLPISYILARIFMDDIGDEYFTTAICDLLRLLIAPMLLTSVWFLFLHGVGQVRDVYSEVDTALKSKRYQITYSSDMGQPSRRKGQNTPPATATLLPAGASAAAFDNEPKALNSANTESVTPSPAAQQAEHSVSEPSLEAVIGTAVAAEIISSANAANDNEQAEIGTAKKGEVNTDDASDSAAADDEIVNSFATEARKAVAKTSAQSKAKSQAHQVKKNPASHTQVKTSQSVHQTSQVQNALPVQEFDPYPAASVPHHTQQQKNRSNSQNHQNNQQRAAQNGQRTVQNNNTRQNQTRSAANAQAQYRQNNGQQRTAQNGQRTVQNNNARQNQNRSVPNSQQQYRQNNGQRTAQNSQRPNNNNTNNHR